MKITPPLTRRIGSVLSSKPRKIVVSLLRANLRGKLMLYFYTPLNTHNGVPVLLIAALPAGRRFA